MMEAVVHTILLLFTLLLQLIISYGAEIHINTPDTRDYTILSNHGIRATDRLLIFQLKACKNGYVGLMSGKTENEPLHEIDFGGHKNTVSFIRAGKSNTLPRLVEIAGPVLHCSEYKEFMITWDSNTINVSHGLDDSGSTFLTWTSPTTLRRIINIGISTAYNANGNWIFHTQDSLQTTTLPYTEISPQISASSLGTATISSSTLTPPTTIDEIASSTTINDVPSTSDSSTMTEHQISVSTDFPTTSDDSSPTNLKTTETSDFRMTSELTTTNSEIDISTNSTTISIFTPTNPETTTSKDLQSITDGTTTHANKPSSISLTTASNDTKTNSHTSAVKLLPTTSNYISTWSQISTSMEMKTIPDNTSSKIQTYDSTSTYKNTATEFEQSIPTTNRVSPPTATALSTSKATPSPASCTKTYTCYCQTASGTSTSSNTVTDLKIDLKTLSSYERRHQSASDPRKSSFYIGCVGIMVLVLFLAFIVLLDFLPRA